jgi:hypothetical protein
VATKVVSSKRERGRAIFRAFLKLEPQFAGESITDWHSPEDEKEFPDIVVRSEVGGFREQMFACIQACDQRWPHEPARNPHVHG